MAQAMVYNTLDEVPQTVKDLVSKIEAGQIAFPPQAYWEDLAHERGIHWDMAARDYSAAMQGAFPARGHAHNILTMDEQESARRKIVAHDYTEAMRQPLTILSTPYGGPNFFMEQYMSGFRQDLRKRTGELQIYEDGRPTSKFVGEIPSLSIDFSTTLEPVIVHAEMRVTGTAEYKQPKEEPKMSLYEVYVVEYDEDNRPTLCGDPDGDEAGPIFVFAPNPTEAIRKATVISGIDAESLDEYDFLPHQIGACRAPKE